MNIKSNKYKLRINHTRISVATYNWFESLITGLQMQFTDVRR